ncbi:MAG TPA: four helix bundle protein [Parafilimonas sp.]|nr:four helix bundle protein [Parafilimonas sp.]
MRNDKDNIIVNKTIEFSLAIINYCEVLEQKKKFVIAKQLLRSATSIGANVFEAQNAESKADFIHKMKIAAKEASETLYWLILCERNEAYYCDAKFRSDLNDIIKILSKIISSAKGKIPGFIWVLLYSFSNFQIFKLVH